MPEIPADVVLIVDDDATNRFVLGLQAERCGHRVETCDDGRSAVARVAAGGVVLVLMDCQMPEMDGFTATREIRRLEGGTRHLPIIAVSAHTTADNRERCRLAGMDDFIGKPVDQDELLAKIHRWLPHLRPHIFAFARPGEGC